MKSVAGPVAFQQLLLDIGGAGGRQQGREPILV